MFRWTGDSKVPLWCECENNVYRQQSLYGEGYGEDKIMDGWMRVHERRSVLYLYIRFPGCEISSLTQNFQFDCLGPQKRESDRKGLKTAAAQNWIWI